MLSDASVEKAISGIATIDVLLLLEKLVSFERSTSGTGYLGDKIIDRPLTILNGDKISDNIQGKPPLKHLDAPSSHNRF